MTQIICGLFSQLKITNKIGPYHYTYSIFLWCLYLLQIMRILNELLLLTRVYPIPFLFHFERWRFSSWHFRCK